MLKITKFGGSSVANADQFRKVKEIVESDPARKYVVVSAPGKRDKSDNKITDLLYLLDATFLIALLIPRFKGLVENFWYLQPKALEKLSTLFFLELETIIISKPISSILFFNSFNFSEGNVSLYEIKVLSISAMISLFPLLYNFS